MNIKGVPSTTAIPQDIPKNEKVYGAAKMYEQQFLREMVKAMRQTVSESELVPKSMGEKIFSEQLDQQYVDGWSERGGIGFADMIYDHIMDKYFNSRPVIPKPKGPLPPDQSKGAAQPEASGVRVKMNQTNIEKPQNVLAPWAGNIRQVTENGKSATVIRHDNGLESQISFSGLGLRAEGRVEAGEKIGIKNAGEEAMFWFVKSNT